jgi:hypothetical protein
MKKQKYRSLLLPPCNSLFEISGDKPAAPRSAMVMEALWEFLVSLQVSRRESYEGLKTDMHPFSSMLQK